jgi:hypothetical protein
VQLSWSRAAVVVAAPLALLGMACPAAAAKTLPANARPAVPHHAPLQHAIGHGPLADRDTSGNWAGYVVTGASKSFTSVESTFTLPTVGCSGGEGDTSFWVGFDGDTSNSVEQIGASGDCNGTTPSYYAWWEMYPAGVHELSNTTKPGDVFDAKVTYGGSGKYTLYLKNETEGWTVTKNETSSSAKDNSAEVIFEAAGPETDAVPEFGPVSMSNNTVNGKSLAAETTTSIDLVRNGHTLVTPGSVGSSGSFSFTWHAAS